MKDTRKFIDDMLSELKTEREELQLKLKLAKMEAGDEWEKLEAKLQKLEAKAGEVGEATAEASKGIGAAAQLLGEEIRNGFRIIAKRL
jgi:BMFP domain-containing protein YqiC